MCPIGQVCGVATLQDNIILRLAERHAPCRKAMSNDIRHTRLRVDCHVSVLFWSGLGLTRTSALRLQGDMEMRPYPPWRPEEIRQDTTRPKPRTNFRNILPTGRIERRSGMHMPRMQADMPTTTGQSPKYCQFWAAWIRALQYASHAPNMH